MDFQTSVRTCLTEKFATFRGRASRSEYWWFVLACVAVGLIISVLGIDILVTLYMLAIIVPATSAGFRRLQDTGRQGWYIFIPAGLSLASMVLLPDMTPEFGADGMMTNMPGMGGAILAGLLSIVQLVLAVIFIYWLTRPSDPRPNSYGAPPAA